MHLLDSMIVHLAQLVSPRPSNCTNSLWKIYLPTDHSDNFLDAGHGHQLKHVAAIADMDVGRIVTNNRGNSRIVEIHKRGQWHALVDVEGRAVENTQIKLPPSTRSSANVQKVCQSRRRETRDRPSR